MQLVLLRRICIILSMKLLFYHHNDVIIVAFRVFTTRVVYADPKQGRTPPVRVPSL